MIKLIPSTPDAVRATIKGFTEIGTDELMLWPWIPQLDQIKLLADLVGAASNV